jgi:hypothetical protein
MRELADAGRIRRLMGELGRESESDARVYFTGGATAVLYGWRQSTIDVDMKIVPELDSILRALPGLKEGLRVNVELASPADFIPVPSGWEDRSPFIARERKINFHHFDLYAQALAKVERGHAQDRDDVRAMIVRELIDPIRALGYFHSIESELYRFPALDPDAFRKAAEEIFRQS